MTRLEVDIDTKKHGERTVISTDLRVVRECTTPRDNSKLEAKLAHAIRMEVVQLLKDVVAQNPTIVKELKANDNH